MNKRTRLGLGIGVAVLIAVQAAVWLIYRAVENRRRSATPKESFQYERASGPAPALEEPLELPNGSVVQLSRYVSEPLVVHFWATWCAPCRTELPALLSLAKNPPGHPRIRFIFVSVDENWATVRHFFDGEIPEGVVRDATGAAKRAYSVETLPDTYVLHSGAILSARIRGARDWGSPGARENLRALVGKE